MEAPRVLSWTTTLALVAAAAPLVALSAPAGAAVQPCMVSYVSATGRAIAARPADKPGHTWNPVDLTVADPRLVTDIDISFDLTHPDAANLSAHVLGPKTDPSKLWPSIQTINAGMASGTLNGAYTFDDEAGAKISGANPVPGRFKPASPATGLEGGTGAGKWSLWLLNDSTSGGTLRSFTLTLTYATCDSDGDGVEESVDNCPTVGNDQANRDGDTEGDACDLDDDGDALADATDGCPSVASSTSTGCPTATRTTAVKHLVKKKKIVLITRSAVTACRPDAEMTLWRKRRGKDLPVVVASTNKSGRVRMKAPKRAGRYYATVAASYAPGAAECGGAKSRTVRLKRRR